MSVSSSFAKDILATTLNVCMFPSTHIASVVLLARTVEPKTDIKCLCPYPDVSNKLLKRFASNWTMTTMNYSTLQYIQPVGMPPDNYAEDLQQKSCNIADF